MLSGSQAKLVFFSLTLANWQALRFPMMICRRWNCGGKYARGNIEIKLDRLKYQFY